jgi:hypothetical protein
MAAKLLGVPFLLCAGALCAQTAANSQPAGLEASWEIAAAVSEIGAHATRLIPLLDRIDTNAWVAKGASDTYAAQLESAKQQANALARGAKVLASNPERLSVALELYFRIQAVETMLGSLEDGLRKYQTPADAQALASLAAENGANRDRLQRYIVNLATQREEEFQVMDREAQRCRAALTQVPARAGRKK